MHERFVCRSLEIGQADECSAGNRGHGAVPWSSAPGRGHLSGWEVEFGRPLDQVGGGNATLPATNFVNRLKQEVEIVLLAYDPSDRWLARSVQDRGGRLVV